MTYHIGFDIFARDHASKTFKDIGDSTEHAHRKMKALGTLAGGVFLAVGAAAVTFGKKSVDAYTESEAIQAKFQQTLSQQPQLHDQSYTSLAKYNSELERKTTFDDEAIASGQTLLAQFAQTGKQLKDSTPIVADLATQLGVSFPSAAKMFGLAVVGNTRALKALGITGFKPTGDKARDYATVMQLVHERTGGAAEAAATTAKGKWQVLQNQFGELQEKVGAQLVPAFNRLVAVGLAVVDWASRNTKVIEILGGAVLGITGAFWATTKVIGLLTKATQLWGIAMSLTPVGKVILLVAALAAGLVYAYKHSETFRNIVNTTFRVVGQAGLWMWNNALKPAFHAIGTAMTWLWTHVGKPYLGLLVTEWRLIAKTALWVWNNAIKPAAHYIGVAWSGVGKAASALWRNVLRPVFTFIVKAWMAVAGAIVHGAATAFGWVPGLGPKLKSAARRFDTFKRDVNHALDGLKDKHITVSAQLGVSTQIAAIGARNKRAAILARARGGPVPMLPGAQRGQDSVPAMLTPNEFVVRADGSNLGDAMAHFGVRGFMRGGVVVGAIANRAGTIQRRVSGGFDRMVQRNHSAIANAVLGAFGAMGNIGGSGVQRWAGLVLRVLAMLHQSASWLPAVLRRMNQESGGNPNAINLWDSNARAGDPSRGLMQTIGSTFNAYAGPFRGLGIFNPLANIYAGLNYALHRYGTLGALAAPGGYDKGGLLPPGLSMVYNGTGRPETVVPPGAGRFGGGVVQIFLDGKLIAEWIEANGKSVQKGLLRVKQASGTNLGLA